ncbi:DUF2147 domain-containing protein [Mesorhizobium sp. BAC0120]|uniref:DUF2147 domain-containing protein n=1 Tax=Mesorhizobium sp. BAC0120 TaxID=3090670 RepID=UPI00298CAA96|nr:DUF2147 domain-containing protein [Mesorhizobium sp. BAC0120]MDW6021160.1 DUF2147 domain-containing protein [Mesorhizobium sp. BAC0120]
MARAIILGVLVAASTLGSAFSADMVVGRWRTKPGDTAAISNCGRALCISLKDGRYAGQQIGRMTPRGDGTYVGSITNPADGKTYSGKGRLEGDSFTMSGCLLGGLICRSQTWVRL